MCFMYLTARPTPAGRFCVLISLFEFMAEILLLRFYY